MTSFKSKFGDKVLDEVFQVLDGLKEKAVSGNFVYRGEPECFGYVRSSLYQQCEERGLAPDDPENPGDWYKQIWNLQKDIVIQATRFLPGQQALDTSEWRFWDNSGHSLGLVTNTPQYKILCQVQHYGGPTNLIDFTTDYFIALFFACHKEHAKQGRIIIFVNRSARLPVRIEDARALSQRSVFIQAQNGFLSSKVFTRVVIPARLKVPLLLYLKQYHAISSEALFPDIQGAVHYWHNNHSFLFLVLDAEQKNRDGNYKEAVEIYNQVLTLSLEVDPVVLTGRGIANFNRLELPAAFDDLSEAISIFEGDRTWPGSSSWGLALCLRGLIHAQEERFEEAFQDISAAREKKQDVAGLFRKEYGRILDFENAYKLCLPTCIKEVLTSPKIPE